MPSRELQSTKENVLEILQIPGTRFGIAFKDLQTGKTILINEKENFHAASTMKTPVLIELFRQAATGRFQLTDSMEIKNDFRSIVDQSSYSLQPADDSQQELYQQIGQKMPIKDLAYEMIIRSSNLATNLLIEWVNADSVMHTMKSIGANDIKVLRGVEDGKAFRQGLNNSTNAFDQMIIYEKMAKGELVNAEASAAMTNILLDQKFNEIIPAKLPADVKVAHKTGSITGILHDAGFVILPDGRKYVLIMLAGFEGAEEKKVMEAMAEASFKIYEYMTHYPK